MATARTARMTEMMAAEMAAIRERQERQARQWEAERKRILEKGTPAQVLELLLQEAGQERCCWVLSEDPSAICGRKNESDWDVYCRKHNRQLYREQERKKAEAHRKGHEPQCDRGRRTEDVPSHEEGSL